MSRIYSIYSNNLDRCWYKSSNIIYSECDDNDNAYKTLRIVFKNGRMYEYYGINVNDYILFKNDLTQGTAFTKYIRKYECKRLEDVDVQAITDELNQLQKHQENECDECN